MTGPSDWAAEEEERCRVGWDGGWAGARHDTKFNKYLEEITILGSFLSRNPVWSVIKQLDKKRLRTIHNSCPTLLTCHNHREPPQPGHRGLGGRAAELPGHAATRCRVCEKVFDIVV